MSAGIIYRLQVWDHKCSPSSLSFFYVIPFDVYLSLISSQRTVNSVPSSKESTPASNVRGPSSTYIFQTQVH